MYGTFRDQFSSQCEISVTVDVLEHTNSCFLWIINLLAAKNIVLNLVENAARLESCEVAEGRFIQTDLLLHVI